MGGGGSHPKRHGIKEKKNPISKRENNLDARCRGELPREDRRDREPGRREPGATDPAGSSRPLLPQLPPGTPQQGPGEGGQGRGAAVRQARPALPWPLPAGPGVGRRLRAAAGAGPRAALRGGREKPGRRGPGAAQQ